jgi:hypothetical protein
MLNHKVAIFRLNDKFSDQIFIKSITHTSENKFCGNILNTNNEKKVSGFHKDVYTFNQNDLISINSNSTEKNYLKFSVDKNFKDKDINLDSFICHIKNIN